MLEEKYSQWGLLEPYLDMFFQERSGYYLEIGAWDGKVFSQSMHLELKGWKGVCVDPFPRNFAERSCLLCAKAISSDGTPRQFLRVTTDKEDGGDVTYLSGFVDSVRTHLDFIKENCNYSYVEIETLTMEQLYEQYHLPSHIDFLSVDTEGAEVEILSSIDFNRYTFSMIMFEHNKDGNTRTYLRHLLELNGYTLVAELEYDDIFVRDPHRR